MANNLQQVSRYLNHSQYFYRQLESTTFVPVALWDIPRRKYLFCGINTHTHTHTQRERERERERERDRKRKKERKKEKETDSLTKKSEFGKPVAFQSSLKNIMFLIKTHIIEPRPCSPPIP